MEIKTCEQYVDDQAQAQAEYDELTEEWKAAQE